MTGLRRHHAIALTVEKTHIQLVLEPDQALRQRWLRNMYGPGGGQQCSQFEGFYERPQMAEIEIPGIHRPTISICL